MSPNTPSNTADEKRRQKAIFLSAVTLSMVMFPIVQNFRDNPDDGFPFSYYPMFTKQRGETTELIHPVAVDASGNETNLDYRSVAKGGMNQVRRQIRKRARKGEAAEMCQETANRILAKGSKGFTKVMIVKDEYELEGFFAGNQEPASREVMASCPLKVTSTGVQR